MTSLYGWQAWQKTLSHMLPLKGITLMVAYQTKRFIKRHHGKALLHLSLCHWVMWRSDYVVMKLRLCDTLNNKAWWKHGWHLGSMWLNVFCLKAWAKSFSCHVDTHVEFTDSENALWWKCVIMAFWRQAHVPFEFVESLSQPPHHHHSHSLLSG